MLPGTHKIQVWVGHHNGPSARYCPLGKYPKWQRESMVATFPGPCGIPRFAQTKVSELWD